MRILVACALLASAARAGEPPPGTVPVTFLGHQSYHVLVGRSFCAAPCVLDLPPGPARLIAVSDGTRRHPGGYLERELVVPPEPTLVELHLGPSPRKAAGLVLAVLGGGYTTVGALAFAAYGALAATALWVLGAVFTPLGVVLGTVGTILAATDRTAPLVMRPDPGAAFPVQ